MRHELPARGSVKAGRVRLNEGRALTPGGYELIIDEPATVSTRRLHYHRQTVVPITID